MSPRRRGVGPTMGAGTSPRRRGDGPLVGAGTFRLPNEPRNTNRDRRFPLPGKYRTIGASSAIARRTVLVWTPPRRTARVGCGVWAAQLQPPASSSSSQESATRRAASAMAVVERRSRAHALRTSGKSRTLEATFSSALGVVAVPDEGGGGEVAREAGALERARERSSGSSGSSGESCGEDGQERVTSLWGLRGGTAGAFPGAGAGASPRPSGSPGGTRSRCPRSGCCRCGAIATRPSC